MKIDNFSKGTDPRTVAANLFAAIEKPIFPLDIEKIALHVGIKNIQEFPDKNLEGMLVADEDKTMGIISVGAYIRELTRRRFTVAHELGHFLITTHTNIQNCISSNMELFKNNKNSMELEANIFAANILMPAKVFREEIQEKKPTRQYFQYLTEYFGTSLTSTIIRYISLTDEPMAVVMSDKLKIRWASRSSSFNYFIPSNVPLSEGTMAMEYFNGNEALYEFEEVEADLWFDTKEIRHHLILREMIWPMPYYNSILSVLWLEEDEDEIEDSSIEFDRHLKIKK